MKLVKEVKIAREVKIVKEVKMVKKVQDLLRNSVFSVRWHLHLSLYKLNVFREHIHALDNV